MPSETVLFDLHGVLITSRRFTVHHRSFSVRSILGLEVVEHARSWRPTAASASLSALTGLAASTTGHPLLAVPAAGFLALSGALFRMGAKHYSLTLHTEDGNFVPLIARDRFLVEAVAKVLQSATRHAAMPVSQPTASPRGIAAQQQPSMLAPAGMTPIAMASPGGTLRMGHRTASPLGHHAIAHSIHFV